MKPLSRLVESVPGSPTTLMMQKGRELAAQGLDVINLAGGEPDFDTPKHIQQAAFDAIAAGDTHYPPSFGTPELLDAICAKLERGERRYGRARSAGCHAGREVGDISPSWPRRSTRETRC